MLNMVSPLFCRQSNELEALQEELRKAKRELSQVREELAHNSAQKDKINSQVMPYNDKTILTLLSVDRDRLKLAAIL